ncbi:hypothetical protein HNY73_015651 [Argiope bruennichi]|uniref:Uncharacterized protein n=1 Tax=Argiope bruennichi TaxID=94029 RepID=A0A8T0EQI7_ARGBR|nr:hypothetical protein HNY73_015651 [Argiope bruennichi]
MGTWGLFGSLFNKGTSPSKLYHWEVAKEKLPPPFRKPFYPHRGAVCALTTWGTFLEDVAGQGKKDGDSLHFPKKNHRFLGGRRGEKNREARLKGLTRDR